MSFRRLSKNLTVTLVDASAAAAGRSVSPSHRLSVLKLVLVSHTVHSCFLAEKAPGDHSLVDENLRVVGGLIALDGKRSRLEIYFETHAQGSRSAPRTSDVSPTP